MQALPEVDHQVDQHDKHLTMVITDEPLLSGSYGAKVNTPALDDQVPKAGGFAKGLAFLVAAAIVAHAVALTIMALSGAGYTLSINVAAVIAAVLGGTGFLIACCAYARAQKAWVDRFTGLDPAAPFVYR